MNDSNIIRQGAPCTIRYLRGGCCHIPECCRQHPITPLVGGGVETPVQLRHGDALGVDDGRNHLELVLLGHLHVGQGGQRLGQDVVGLGLAAHGLSYDHHSVPHIQHGVKLADLLQEPVRGLEIVLETQVL